MPDIKQFLSRRYLRLVDNLSRVLSTVTVHHYGLENATSARTHGANHYLYHLQGKFTH